jgi:hypothetical protein
MPPFTRHLFWLGLLAIAFDYWPARVVAGDPSEALTWSLRDGLKFDAAYANPVIDAESQPVWYFMRTTRSDGPIESRQWLRDGRYVPLTESGEKLQFPARGLGISSKRSAGSGRWQTSHKL